MAENKELKKKLDGPLEELVSYYRKVFEERPEELAIELVCTKARLSQLYSRCGTIQATARDALRGIDERPFDDPKFEQMKKGLEFIKSLSQPF